MAHFSHFPPIRRGALTVEGNAPLAVSVCPLGSIPHHSSSVDRAGGAAVVAFHAQDFLIQWLYNTQRELGGGQRGSWGGGQQQSPGSQVAYLL